MTAVVVDDVSVGYTADDVATKVIGSPSGGSGVFYPNTPPPGIALQLGALGIVLALLSAAFAHLFSPAATGMVIPVAFTVGAIAIFTGGVVNFRAGIQVAGVIGVLYGTFWLSVGITLQFTSVSLVKAVGADTFSDAFGTYLLLWGVMSLGLCLPVWFVSKVVFAQQALLAVVFFVLSASYYAAPGGVGLGKLGGVLGLVDAALCFYISMTLVTNETAGKPVLPLP